VKVSTTDTYYNTLTEVNILDVAPPLAAAAAAVVRQQLLVSKYAAQQDDLDSFPAVVSQSVSGATYVVTPPTDASLMTSHLYIH